MERLPSYDNQEAEPKFHVCYTNNDLPGRPIVFECFALNQEEADQKFKEAMGKDPERGGHIGCIILKN